MVEYDFEVSYRPGKDNASAGFLSRPFSADGTVDEDEVDTMVRSIVEEASPGVMEGLDDHLKDVYRCISMDGVGIP